MPKVSIGKDGKGMIRWDGSDWLKGLVPQYGLATNSITDVEGLATATGIDPFRLPGYLSPGASPTDYTNVSTVASIIKNGLVFGFDGYLVGGAKLFKTSSLTIPALLSNATWPHTIPDAGHGGHTSFVMEDCVEYYLGSTPYLWYSWNDNTDGDIGRHDFAAAFNDDYMSTVATGGAVLNALYPHPLVVGYDNKMYCGNGNNLAVMDGTTGTAVWNTSALDLPTDYVISSYSKTKEYLVIYAYKSSYVIATAAYGYTSNYKTECTAFFWDYVSSSFTYAINLPGNYINGGFNIKGTVGCFTEGSRVDITNAKNSRMFLFDGSEFKVVQTFSDVIPAHGGVATNADTIFWNSAGQIYQFGSPHLKFPEAINRVSKLGGTTRDGMLKFLYANSITGSSGTTTTGGLQAESTGYYDSASATLPVVNLSFPEENVGKVRTIKIYWYKQAAANSSTLDITLNTGRGNISSSYIMKASLATTRQTVPTNLVSKFENLDDSGNPFPSFDSLGLGVTYVAGSSKTAVPAIIEAIEVYFDTIKIQ